MDAPLETNQEVIIPSTQKPKTNFLIVALVFIGIFLTLSLIYFGYQLSLSKKQEITPPTPTPLSGQKFPINSPKMILSQCTKKKDCTLVLRLDECCRCPEPISKEELSKDKNLVEYEPGKDYSQAKLVSCKDIACNPCELLSTIVCNQGQCQFQENQDNQSANWKTYQSKSKAFEFKYPNSPNWQVEESDNFVALYNYDVKNAPGRDYDPILDKNLFKVEIFVDSQHSDVDKWFEEERTKPNPMTDLPEKYSNVKKITVDSQKGIYYEIESPFLIGSASFESPHGGLIHFNGGLNFKDNQELFDQILKTFKFLDENPEGRFCGGIAANLPEFQCPQGYRCKLDGNYPDAGGKCVKE